jgi:hypothetical protein
VFDFTDLRPQGPVPVKYNGKEYQLHDPGDSDGDVYNAARYRCKTESGVDHEKLGATNRLLVSLCLTNGDGSRVPEEQIARWHPTVVDQLATWCRKAGGWEAEEDDAAELEKEIAGMQDRLEAAKSRDARVKN